MERLLNAVFDGAYVVDPGRRIVASNDSAVSLTGYHREEVLHRCCSDDVLVHVDESGRQLCTEGCPLRKTLEDGQLREGTVALRHKLGYRVPGTVRILPIFNDNGHRITGAVEIFHTGGEPQYWKIRVAELERLAFVDQLTGIPNRRFLEAQVEGHLQQLQSVGAPFALCMLDVDHFKAVNDRYGHEAGDRLLNALCRTLSNCMRAADMLGRWGGDELMLLLAQSNVAQVTQTLQRLRALIAQTTVSVNGELICGTVSIGAALARPAENRDSLLERADRQLYLAKQSGRNCSRVE
jgi:diguanylate cyclase (GGDEF)-like protein